jgi:hypothetical protein
LIHASISLCFIYFWVGSHFYAQVDLDPDPPMYLSCIAGMTSVCHHTQLFIG